MKSKWYEPVNYDSSKRFDVYKTQAACIESISGKQNISTILEIGVGSGFMKNYLQNKGIKVYSIDYYKKLNPDKVIDISKKFMLKDSYDITLCFQVLEHIDESKLEQVLNNIYEIKSKKFIFSIPIKSWFFNISFKIPLIKTPFETIFFINKNKETTSNERKWELGQKNHSINWFKETLKKANFNVIEAKVYPSDPLHAYFLCKK